MGVFIKDAKKTFEALRFHPNFELPKVRKEMDHQSVADFVIETVARFISPPKVKDEDEYLKCENIASAIRKILGPEIKDILEKNAQSDIQLKKSMSREQMLKNVVRQVCTMPKGSEYELDSFNHSLLANAIRELAELGCVEIIDKWEFNDGIKANWV